VIESVSILTNRVLLRKSDSIGVMPYHVALDDVEHGLLSILPVKLKSMELRWARSCVHPATCRPRPAHCSIACGLRQGRAIARKAP